VGTAALGCPSKAWLVAAGLKAIPKQNVLDPKTVAQSYVEV
jgi:hypothetical protein